MFIIFTCTPWHTKGLYLWILLRSSLKLLILSSLVRKLSHSNLIAAWKMEMNKTQKILNFWMEWNEFNSFSQARKIIWFLIGQIQVWPLCDWDINKFIREES